MATETSPPLSDEYQVPDVTVILAHFNDGQHVTDAVRSVYGQTHRNLELILVDDCSTDGSGEVAERAVNIDSRGQFVKMPVNSGGVGGPRRRGLELARGKFVVFLDSDDTLDRHACRNLLKEAEQRQSDIVMARTRRFDIESKQWRGWHDRLFSEEQYFASIEDNPDLAIDTIVVAKLYRTSFLRDHDIQFPTDIHYEDLVFSANAFMNARGISVIPESAYVWNIYPSEVRKSITNQRDSLKNLEYRLEALRRVMNIVDAEKNPGLLARLQLKVLRHDARLYLNDIVDHEDGLARSILEHLRPFLMSIPTVIYGELDRQERFLFGAALLLDVSRVRESFTMIRNRATWLPPLELSSDDRNYLWGNDDVSRDYTLPLAKELLSVPSEDLRRMPWFQVKWEHRVQSVEVKGDCLLISGQTFDPARKLADLENLKLQVRIFSRGEIKFNQFIDCSDFSVDGQFCRWTSNIKLANSLDYAKVKKFGLRIRMTNGMASCEDHLLVQNGIKFPKRKLRAGGLFSSALSYRYRVYPTVDRTLGLRITKSGTPRKAVRAAIEPVHGLVLKVLRSADKPVAVEAPMWRWVYSLMRTLPLQPERTLFESHMGTSFADSPRAISNELRSQWTSVHQTWSFAENYSPIEEVPFGTVVRHSPRYLYALARSGYLVDNQSLPSYFRKRAGQKYLQLWHGIPLKKMGFDEPDFSNASSGKRANLQKKVSYWDYLTVPSPYFEETFVPAFGYSNELLRYGSPRNDSLAVLTSQDQTNIRRSLGLSERQKVVLYAPTFRAESRGSRRAIRLELDLEQWCDSMGDDCVLLVRAHYLNKINIHPRFFGKVIDVSNVPEISNLYAIADVLVTDYSSVMFDYLTVDRPIAIYAYDYDKYVDDERGTYFSLREHSPGRISETQDDLQESVRIRLNEDVDAELRAEFQHRFAGHESGRSSVETVARIWGKK